MKDVINIPEMPQRLKAARILADLTQQQVADAMGFSRPTMPAIEKGQRKVTTTELAQFARLCNVSVSDLVTPDDSFLGQLRRIEDGLARQRYTILALRQGGITEGVATAVLKVDRLDVREMLQRKVVRP